MLLTNSAYRLPDSKKPIIVFKQAQKLQELLKNNNEYFLCATTDRHVYLIECDPAQQKFISILCSLTLNRSAPTELFLDTKSLYYYVGYSNGDVQWFHLQNFNNFGKIDQKTIKFYEQTKPSSEKHVVLMYTRGNNLYVWDIKSRLKIISVTTAEILGTYDHINEQLTAAASFYNPFSYSFIGCLCFKQYGFPFLFDGTKIDQISNCYQVSIIEYQENQKQKNVRKSLDETILSSQREYHNDQIIEIKTLYENDKDKIFIICGVLEIEKKSYAIKIFQMYMEQRIETYICENFRKIEMKGQILNLSIKEHLIMATMWDRVQFVRFQSNDCRKIIAISRKGMGYCWGFILSHTDNKIKFLYNKGFNYLEPKNSQLGAPSLKIKNKTYD